MSIERTIRDYNRRQRELIAARASSAALKTQGREAYERKLAVIKEGFTRLIAGRKVVAQQGETPDERHLSFEPVTFGTRTVLIDELDSAKGKRRPVVIAPEVALAGADFAPRTLRGVHTLHLTSMARLAMPEEARVSDLLYPGCHVLDHCRLVLDNPLRPHPTGWDLRQAQRFATNLKDVLAATQPRG